MRLEVFDVRLCALGHVVWVDFWACDEPLRPAQVEPKFASGDVIAAELAGDPIPWPPPNRAAQDADMTSTRKVDSRCGEVKQSSTVPMKDGEPNGNEELAGALDEGAVSATPALDPQHLPYLLTPDEHPPCDEVAPNDRPRLQRGPCWQKPPSSTTDTSLGGQRDGDGPERQPHGAETISDVRGSRATRSARRCRSSVRDGKNDYRPWHSSCCRTAPVETPTGAAAVETIR